MYELPVINIQTLQRETRKNNEWERCFEDKLSPFLKKKYQSWEFSDKLMKHYITPTDIREIPADMDRDILLEKNDDHEPVQWLVHKYNGRVLLTISYTCAANCWFCERQDRVWVWLDKEWMAKKELADEMVNYIKSDSSIKEVIFSWWDPMMNLQMLEYIVDNLTDCDHVKFIRIHSKKPIQSPEWFQENGKDYNALNNIKNIAKDSSTPKQTFFSVHVNCPDELFEEVKTALTSINDLGYKMLNQNVFLRWINDDAQVLQELYEELSYLWVTPYYIYHCQDLPTTNRYIIPIEEERRIMSELKQITSGHCVPEYVIDIQWTTWKIAVPHSYITEIHQWKIVEVLDFKGNKLSIQDYK